MSIDEVKQAIRDAFALVEMPLDHEFIDCSMDNDPFYRVPWEVVPPDVLDVEPLMFTPKGYQYYLPAFLFNALNGGNNEHLMAELCQYPSRESKYWVYFLKKASVLSNDQAKAILLFLEYIQETGEEWDREDARRGIDAYWSQAAQGHPPTLDELVARGFVANAPKDAPSDA